MNTFPIETACGDKLTTLEGNLLRIKFFDNDNMPNDKLAIQVKLPYAKTGYHLRNGLTKLRKEAIIWPKEKQMEYCLGNTALYKHLFEQKRTF